MPPNTVSFVQEDFSAGEVRDVSPHLIPPNAVGSLENGLLSEDGAVFKRGGTANLSGAAFGAAGLRFLADTYLKPGRRTVFANGSDFGVLDANDSSVINLGGDGMASPKPYAVIDDLMFIGGGYIYGGSRKAGDATTGLAYSTGTVSTTNGSRTVTGAGTTWNTLVDAGMLFQTASSERVYVVESIDSTTQITLRDAYEGTTAAGKTYGLYSIYEIVTADPYETADFYAAAQNRLFSLSGQTLKFTDLNATTGQSNPHSYPANNFHRVPDGASGTGLAPVANGLLIFTTAGVWTLRGIAFDIVDAAGNPQHTMELYSRELALWGAQGITGWESTAVVPAADGVFLLDGIRQPVRLSRPIEPLYSLYAEGNYYPGQAVVYENHYFLPVIRTSDNGVKETLVCRLDQHAFDRRRRVTFPWSRFNGAGGTLSAYAVRVGDTTRAPKLLGAEGQTTSRVVNASNYFRPQIAYKQDADGSNYVFDLVTRDYPTGNGTENVVRKVRTYYELRDAASDNPTLQFSYSIGTTRSGVPVWDQVNWDEFNWADEDASLFFTVNCDAPETDGLTPHDCKINDRMRYLRWRIRQLGPAESCVIRGVETVTRPSRAVRK